MDKEKHDEDHRWITERREHERRWADRKDSTVKAIFVWLIVSVMSGIMGIFAYAAKMFWGNK